MIQSLSNNWLLLALSGVLDAIMAVLYLVVQNAEGSRPFYAWQSTVTWLGEITLAAGVCAGFRQFRH